MATCTRNDETRTLHSACDAGFHKEKSPSGAGVMADDARTPVRVSGDRCVSPPAPDRCTLGTSYVGFSGNFLSDTFHLYCGDVFGPRRSGIRGSFIARTHLPVLRCNTVLCSTHILSCTVICTAVSVTPCPRTPRLAPARTSYVFDPSEWNMLRLYLRARRASCPGRVKACLRPTRPTSALTLRAGALVASKRENRKAVAKDDASR